MEVRLGGGRTGYKGSRWIVEEAGLLSGGE